MDSSEKNKINSVSLTQTEVMQVLRSPIQQALEDVGITVDMLAKQLIEELQATDTKYFAHQGVVVDARQTIDWATRQRARMDIHKLRGDYAPETHNLNLRQAEPYTPEEEEILRKAAEEVAQRRIEDIRQIDTVVEGEFVANCTDTTDIDTDTE